MPENSDPMKQVVAALIVKDDEILICQRNEHQPHPLKWEFPGGKIEANEDPAAALCRELEEELGITAEMGSKVATIQHNYAIGNAVELHFYLVKKFEGEIQNLVFKDVRWAKRTELSKFDFLEADVALVQEIARGKIF